MNLTMKKNDVALTDTQREMVEANMDVVRWAIHTSIRVNEQLYGFGYDDLFQEGCIWLCKAAVTYDPSGSARFPTYAQKVVENGLRTYCRLLRSKERRCFPVPEIFDMAEDSACVRASNVRSLQEQLAEVGALSLLESAKQQYDGVARLGIEAMQLKFIGLSNTDIAAHYGVKANYLGAAVHRAAERLKANSEFLKSIEYEPLKKRSKAS